MARHPLECGITGLGRLSRRAVALDVRFPVFEEVGRGTHRIHMHTFRALSAFDMHACHVADVGAPPISNYGNYECTKIIYDQSVREGSIWSR